MPMTRAKQFEMSSVTEECLDIWPDVALETRACQRVDVYSQALVVITFPYRADCDSRLRRLFVLNHLRLSSATRQDT
jgi:hypothetical protein